MAYIVMAYIVMAYIVMAYIVMAYIVMAYIVMAYIVMAKVLAKAASSSRPPHRSRRRPSAPSAAATTAASAQRSCRPKRVQSVCSQRAVIVAASGTVSAESVCSHCNQSLVGAKYSAATKAYCDKSAATCRHCHNLYRHLGTADGMCAARDGGAGAQNDRLSKAVILSTGTPVPAQRTCRRRCRDA